MRLSCRGCILHSLERWFPPVNDAPVDAGEHSPFEYCKAPGSYGPFVREMGGISGKTVLDFGCGWGGESAWLAERGAAHVDGCDISGAALADAERFGQRRSLSNLRFARSGPASLPYGDGRFDAVFSTNVFEHVMEPEAMLREIRRVLRPGGSFLSTFGPLFYSPYGGHLSWVTQVPYAHILFGLKPIIQVRNLKRRPMEANSWRDTSLNMLTFGGFRRAVDVAGFECVRLKRIPVKNQRWLAHLPLFGDLFSFGVDCHLRKR